MLIVFWTLGPALRTFLPGHEVTKVTDYCRFKCRSAKVRVSLDSRVYK